jgi:TolB-like protein
MNECVRFNDYLFDGRTGRLWGGAGEIRLTPKAAAVLAALVTQAGTPVSRHDLFATVWSDTAVGDDALTSCVQELRRALHDDARQPRFIETRHRRGYRFIATVSPPIDAGDHSALVSGDAIAVLPFVDMSPGRDQDYLCESLVEELINVLTHVGGLRIAASNASLQSRGGADIQALGRHLGAGTLLEGSVRKAGERLRVTVRLTDVASGYHQWSQRYDCSADDVFALQDEIAAGVAIHWAAAARC